MNLAADSYQVQRPSTSRPDTVALLQVPDCWRGALDRAGTCDTWLHDWTGQDLVQHGRDHVHTRFAAAQERELAV